ncbi:MAG TPA: hypothetical protein VKN99_06395, partial [Polyangia bacterium]|nr:hypothetical protein [Polyangia bacterium]
MRKRRATKIDPYALWQWAQMTQLCLQLKRSMIRARAPHLDDRGVERRLWRELDCLRRADLRA